MGKFTVQDRSVAFNVRVGEVYIDMVFDSILQLAFKNLSLLSFGVVSKKSLHSDLKTTIKIISLSNNISV